MKRVKVFVLQLSWDHPELDQDAFMHSHTIRPRPSQPDDSMKFGLPSALNTLQP